SGAVIPGRYYGLEPLIVYEPDYLPSTLGFTRASSAMTRGRDGAWYEVAANIPRTTWRRDASGVLVPATLLEPGSTNLLSDWRLAGLTAWESFNGGTIVFSTPEAPAQIYGSLTNSGVYANISG